jgi:sulfopyruvate decarboxylase TPP-binding subunit
LTLLSSARIVALIEQLGITHVVTVPDSTVGQWQRAIEEHGRARLVRVCREGEAWEVAAGLHLGGAAPLVTIQCTGLFESGDAIRNVLHDWRLPIPSIIGYRSFLNQDTLPGDTCLTFTEPILDAWRIDYRLVTTVEEAEGAGAHLLRCRNQGRPGAILLAEGKA